MNTRILLALAVFIVLLAVGTGLLKKKYNSKENIQSRLFGLQSAGEEKTEDGEWTLSDKAGGKKKSKRLEDTPFAERVLIPAKRYITAKMLTFTPKAIHDYIEHQLVLAGKKAKGNVGTFVFLMLVTGVVGGGFMFIMMMSGDKAFIQRLMFIVMGFVGGAAMPILMLRSQIRKRQEKIRRQMPEMLDLLCVSVEAGLSFDAALRKISDRMQGALIDECKKMLDDVRMGVTRREAMQNMALRCDVQEVSLFVTSVLQAERLGSNMSNTLATQADNVRERHRQYIKAMALKAPVKIVLPLVGFILPAIFIVALGPAMYNVAKNF